MMATTNSEVIGHTQWHGEPAVTRVFASCVLLAASPGDCGVSERVAGERARKLRFRFRSVLACLLLWGWLCCRAEDNSHSTFASRAEENYRRARNKFKNNTTE